MTPQDDVVQALERLYVNVRPEYPFGVRDWEIVKAAIDRLDAKLRERDWSNERVRLEARVRELERERETWLTTTNDAAAAHYAAENAKLREALERIRDTTFDDYDSVVLERCIEIARAALAHPDDIIGHPTC